MPTRAGAAYAAPALTRSRRIVPEAPFFSALTRSAGAGTVCARYLGCDGCPAPGIPVRLSFFCCSAGARSGKSSSSGQRQRPLFGALFLSGTAAPTRPVPPLHRQTPRREHARSSDSQRGPNPPGQLQRHPGEHGRHQTGWSGHRRSHPPGRDRQGSGQRVHHGPGPALRLRSEPGQAGRGDGWPALGGRGPDHQQGLRVRAQGGDAGGPGHLCGRRRGGGRRRHGMHEHGALFPQESPLRLPHGRRHPARPHGP